jgi:Flp pilus assembly pilin Flp
MKVRLVEFLRDASGTTAIRYALFAASIAPE